MVEAEEQKIAARKQLEAAAVSKQAATPKN
jgi:hypothetical protein